MCVLCGRTSLLSDAPPSVLELEPRRNRRVHCSSLVRHMSRPLLVCGRNPITSALLETATTTLTRNEHHDPSTTATVLGHAIPLIATDGAQPTAFALMAASPIRCDQNQRDPVEYRGTQDNQCGPNPFHVQECASAERRGERWRRAPDARICQRVAPAAIRSTEKLANVSMQFCSQAKVSG